MFLQNQLLSYSATLCLPYSIYCTEIGNLMIIIIAIIAHYFLINSVQIKCKQIAKQQPTTLLHPMKYSQTNFPLAGSKHVVGLKVPLGSKRL